MSTTCLDCQQHKKIHARGLCKNCYVRHNRNHTLDTYAKRTRATKKTATCADCGRVTTIHVASHQLCRRCYTLRLNAGTLNTSKKTTTALQTISVPCRRCGKPVTCHIWPGTKPPIKYCRNCKQIENHDTAILNVAQLRRCRGRFTPAKAKNYPPVTVYRPGTPEFDRIAAQITPLAQIRKTDRTYNMVFKDETL